MRDPTTLTASSLCSHWTPEQHLQGKRVGEQSRSLKKPRAEEKPGVARPHRGLRVLEKVHLIQSGPSFFNIGYISCTQGNFYYWGPLSLLGPLARQVPALVCASSLTWGQHMATCTVTQTSDPSSGLHRYRICRYQLMLACSGW